MPVLQVNHITKIYHSISEGNVYKALNGISFEVEKGEFVGIMGPSGAGKSTLLNVIATIDEVSSGTISIGNQNITKLNENQLALFRRNKLGFIFQDYNLLDTLTLQENIALPLILSKISSSEIVQRVNEIAKTLDIVNLLSKYPYQISGGQRQRASAARAIITQPELIFADEPTGALDSKSAGELLQCLSDLNKNVNATILLVTHDAFTASYCKRILFIKDGTIFTEIHSNGDQKAFFDEILHMQAMLGGSNRELV